MEQHIKIGDVVKHRKIMSGTDLYVIKLNREMITVRYTNQGLFRKQKLYLHEVELFVIDEDEFS